MKKLLLVSAVAALAFTVPAHGAIFGGFAPHQSFAVGDAPRQVKVADFNGDGALDLAACNANSNDVAVLISNGDGTFAAAVFYPVEDTPLSVSAADLDSDGDIDLTVANGNTPSISVLFGNGNGTFVTHQTVFLDPNEPPYPGVMMVHTMADFDGDDDTDIAVVTLTATLIMILPNDGSGTFGPPVVIDEVPGAGFPTDLEPGDFDGDGDIDLITIRGYLFGHSGARVLLNNGDATSWLASEFDAEADGIVSPPADFNGDGILDLALSRTINPDGYMLVTLGNGDGTFGAQTTYPVNRPYPPTTSDLDGDGDIDIIVPSFNPYNTVSVMLGNGDGTFAAPLPFAVGGNNPQDLVAVDIDGDLWPDIVSANRGGDCVNVFINLTCQGDLDGDGDVDLEDLAQLLAHYGTAEGATYADGDIDGDGDVDLSDLAALLANYGTAP